ncbi:hypothetical protein [Nostoc sp. FACHB-280]|uniref:hypothetical protein n=1 Tax=Nostoc sp. FACHB-280 TaxID=2692839 RepID=UPI00168B5C33|nr:hypothetical protein [Nostoc sp. FACHB-280]MBD2498913.1 hypothetical protein [Nostoc sp. FACHB-280]
MNFANFRSLSNGLFVSLWRSQIREYTFLILIVAGFILALAGFLLQPEPVSRHLVDDGIFGRMMSRMYDLLKDTLYADHHINLKQ